MAAVPRLADVHCTPLRFQPGDRILVRVLHPISPEDRKKLKRAVERWAGNCVEVFVYDTSSMEIEIEHAGERLNLKLSPDFKQ
jgi:hypothetical protein